MATFLYNKGSGPVVVQGEHLLAGEVRAVDPRIALVAAADHPDLVIRGEMPISVPADGQVRAFEMEGALGELMHFEMQSEPPSEWVSTPKPDLWVEAETAAHVIATMGGRVSPDAGGEPDTALPFEPGDDTSSFEPLSDEELSDGSDPSQPRESTTRRRARTGRRSK